MELLVLVSLCLLTFTGKTFGDKLDQTPIIIKEDESVILPCSFSTSLTNYRFDWKKDGKDVFLYENGRVNPSSPDEQFNGRVSHFPDEVKSGNASITIKQVKVSDSGTYTCLNLDGKEEERQQIKLTVGAFAKPLVSSHITADWALLRCEVLDASPEPTVVWYDSDGNNVSDRKPEVRETGGRYNIILETKVTKTDNYTCVATQNELNHQSNKTTSVNIKGTCPKPTIRIIEKLNNGTLVECKVRGVFPALKMEFQNRANFTVSAGAPQPSPNGINEYILRHYVTKEDHYHCVVTQDNICHQISSEENLVHVTSGASSW
ncbi:V-set domain-containing T-cell activation inhibitor 1-like isoform X2 [Girardinichthys multiradiatus]|uniref:V-set domain-containing T-cell activation inhibitor 1-like isoform X2 n=1 Tax=Girardinichthys multiradiatus TaxID=208333 RepID=UPI001FABC66C|nr:V-set domain-containing T-cell activation inhibitor 1-like isoform X2 [Girardinichthys multiradiatus]